MADEPTQKKDYRCPRCGKRFTAEVVWRPDVRGRSHSCARVVVPRHATEHGPCPASLRPHTLAAAAGEVEAIA